MINAPEKVSKQMTAASKKKNHKNHKANNANKVIRDDKKFQKFVKNFMSEQKVSGRERSNNGKTY